MEEGVEIKSSLKLMIECAKMDLTSIENPNEEEAKIVEKGVSDSIYTLGMMLRFQLWNPDYSEWTLLLFNCNLSNNCGFGKI